MTFRNFAALVLGVSLLASPAFAAGNDPLIDEIAPFKLVLLQKFDAKQFAELEKLEQELQSGKARFAGGDWKLFHFFKGLSAANPQWYVTALRIAQGLQWPRDRAESLVKEVAAIIARSCTASAGKR